ncbi:hypothetical protein TRV_06100 [Trichophyton verrucosum HKI 0517]|uniref:Uncharacterized protein n=1 Tax=Trichophyton verrucosum (strain HKI 0517) TaxID=663202 RepID=D4DFZ8_TRIVH|nr:uncharacterized protein TRV_06100 [Trichophyton verrucosum HKI 0517]EFE39188.1 hypothetical protein TRV_06100 [Trichophyton verrucosum HKI 0517]
MNPHRLGQSSGNREPEGANTIPFPPFPYDMPEEVETFNSRPTQLQGPPPQYTGSYGRLAGYPGEAAKYASVIRDKLGADPLVTHTHTHHYSYMENTFRPQPPITYDAASRLALANPATNNSYVHSQPTAQAESFAAGAATSPEGFSHYPQQERGRPFYRGAPSFRLRSQGRERSQPAYQHSSRISRELRETGHLTSTRPSSLATLAALTTKPNLTTTQGSASFGVENTTEMEYYYHNHGIPGTRSNSRVVTAINPALTAHPLQNMAAMETGGNHGHAVELPAHFNPHLHSPHRARHIGQHSFSVDPGSSHYTPPAFAPPSMPRSIPQVNFARHTKNATLSAPATSVATPTSKTRPTTPTGPFIPGPDNISPSKQEEKLHAQKTMMERLGDTSIANALDIDFSRLTINQADHYLDLIGAPSRPKPESAPVRNVTAGEGELVAPKLAPQSLAPEKSMTASLSPHDHQLPQRSLPSPSSQNYSNDLERGTALAARYNIRGLAITRLAMFRQEREAAMAQEREASPQVAAGSRAPSPTSTKVNLSATPCPSEGRNNTATQQPGIRRSFPPPGLTRPRFTNYAGDPVGIYRPVPWTVDTPEEAERKAKKAETATTSEAGKQPPVLPPANTLQQSPIGSKRRSILLAKERNSRVSETLKWYRADYRWNEGLRERLDTIIKENLQTRDNGQEPVAIPKELYESAEQNTVLLAQAIVNLQSYLEGNPKEQSRNFAQYGPAPDECCEPSKDGNFSLFDIQPGPFRGSETRN